MIKWRRYEVMMPQQFNDGSPVSDELVGEAMDEIIANFGAASFETQKIEGRWRYRGVIYRDILLRLFVDVHDTAKNRAWIKKFKARWKDRLKQLELWVVSYPIEIE